MNATPRAGVREAQLYIFGQVNIDPEARMAEWWMGLPEAVANQWLKAARIEPAFPPQPWLSLTPDQRKAILTKIKSVTDIYRASKLDRTYHIPMGVME